jgi:hypothetical protein
MDASECAACLIEIVFKRYQIIFYVWILFFHLPITIYSAKSEGFPQFSSSYPQVMSESALISGNVGE